MKTKYFLFALLLAANSVSAQNKTVAEDFKKLNWLVGTWNRTNSKPGRAGVELWKQSSPNELRGLGATLHERDTLFVERLRIIIKDNYIAYVADVPENQKLVYFKLTEITANSFICENPEHDFPKKISYQYDGKQLKAQISGDGKAVDYLFEKK